MKAKNLGVLILLATFTTLLGYATVNALSTIAAVDFNGTTQSNFTEGDAIYMDGQCTDAEDNLVDVYVVPNNSSWLGGEPLIDVRGAPQPEAALDPVGNFALTQVWGSAVVGEYDLVIDVWRNAIYDSAVDCIDSANSVGFTVDAAVAVGSGSVSKGSNDPGDHEWGVGTDPNNVMLQLELSVDNSEDVDVQSVSLSAGGTGDDRRAVNVVRIYEDEDADGLYNSDPDLWGSGTFPTDSGNTTINVSETIAAGTSKTIIVVYEMGPQNYFQDGDTFEVSVTDVEATGVDSSQDVSFSGLPKGSGTKTVSLPELPEPCSGTVSLGFDQSEYEPGDTITATVSGFSDCEGETAKVYENACGEGLACECNPDSNASTSCSCDFTAPEIEGIYTFAGCLDINTDTDFDDSGEEDSKILTVAEAVEEPTETPFEDTQDHWAEDYIDDLYNAGVVSGRSENAFEPNELITRAEVTKIAMLAFEHAVPESITESPFPDVSSDAWFGTYVTGAQDAEIIEGYPDGFFRPGQNINRVEVLKILIEAAGKDAASAVEATFPDTDAEAWYAAYINYGIANSIVGGYTSGTLAGMFAPANFATRAEVAKMTSVLMSN